MEQAKKLRKMRGLTQADLAVRSGASAFTISMIEQGKREPHPSTLRRLAEALEVEVEDFFREELPVLRGTGRGSSLEVELRSLSPDELRRMAFGSGGWTIYPASKIGTYRKVENLMYRHQVSQEEVFQAVCSVAPVSLVIEVMGKVKNQEDALIAYQGALSTGVERGWLPIREMGPKLVEFQKELEKDRQVSKEET